MCKPPETLISGEGMDLKTALKTILLINYTSIKFFKKTLDYCTLPDNISEVAFPLTSSFLFS